MIIKHIDDKEKRYWYVANSIENQEIFVREIGFESIKSKRNVMKRNIYALHYCVSGSGTFCGKPIKTGDCYIVVPGEEEIYNFKSKETKCAWIRFDGTNVNKILRKLNLPRHNDCFEFEKSAECTNIIQDVISKKFRNNFEESCAIYSAFYNILSIHAREIERIENTTRNVANEVADFFEKNFSEKIKIDDVAKDFHYTRNYLYKMFKTEYGMSPQNYLTNIRVKNAEKLLLSNTPLSIKEIAASVGFEDSLYFSRIFKKITGNTPTERKKFLKKNLSISENMPESL